MADSNSVIGLLEDDPEKWAELCEEVVSREVMKKLKIPELVRTAIESLRDGWVNIPPSTLLDTLLLANQFSPVPSPLARQEAAMPEHDDSVLDFAVDKEMLRKILDESAAEVRSVSAALLV